MRVRFAALSFCVLLGSGGFVAACGSDSSSSSEAAPAVGTCKAPADECAIASTADVTAAAGEPVTESPTKAMMGPGNASLGIPASGGCAYAGSGKGAGNSYQYSYQCGLTMIAHDAFMKTYQSYVALGAGVEIPGLGDYAVWVPVTGPGDAGSLSGGNLMTVSGNANLTVSVVTNAVDAKVAATSIARKVGGTLF